MPLRPLPALLAAAALTGCASGYQDPGGSAVASADTDGRSCFWTRSVNGFSAPDDRSVNVSVSVNDVYRLEFMGSCPGIDWDQRIAIESRGTSHICSGLDATVIAPSPTGPIRCPVRTVRHLTPAEVAALPADERP